MYAVLVKVWGYGGVNSPFRSINMVEVMVVITRDLCGPERVWLIIEGSVQTGAGVAL